MKQIKIFSTVIALLMATFMTSCLHIVEEVDVKKNGSGTYTMKLDMSEMKSMMDMFKGMEGMSEAEENIVVEEDDDEVRDIVVERDEEDDHDNSNPMGDADPSKIGEEFTNVSETLKLVKGLTNVESINDTAAFIFGYTFDFQDIESLNEGLELVNKEKFDSKAENVYKADKKGFKRSGAANFGAEIKRALSEGEGEEGAEAMGMMKMFFGEMSYKQIYHFEKKIKKSSNKYSEISEDGHTLTIKVMPFSDAYQDATVATEVKLK